MLVHFRKTEIDGLIYLLDSYLVAFFVEFLDQEGIEIVKNECLIMWDIQLLHYSIQIATLVISQLYSIEIIAICFAIYLYLKIDFSLFIHYTIFQNMDSFQLFLGQLLYPVFKVSD